MLAKSKAYILRLFVVLCAGALLAACTNPSGAKKADEPETTDESAETEKADEPEATDEAEATEELGERPSACPDERVYGDPEAPNKVVFENASGKRTIHFSQAAGSVDISAGEVSGLVKFPPIENRIEGSDRDPFELRLSLNSTGDTEDEDQQTWFHVKPPSRLQIDCMVFHFPERIEVGARSAAFSPGPDAASHSLSGSFEFDPKDDGDTHFSGSFEVDEAPVKHYVETKPGEKTVANGVKFERVAAIYDPTGLNDTPNTLQVDIHTEKSESTGEAAWENFFLRSFDGEPGVYVEEVPSSKGTRDIFIVDKFGADGLKMSVIRVAEERLPGGTPSAEEAKRLGEPYAHVTTSYVATMPELEPVDFEAAR